MSYELLQKRLAYGCGTNENSLIKMKERSFQVALARAYNAENVVHKDEEYRVIINENRQKIDYDEKIISAPNEMNLHIGSTIHSLRTDTRWIVTTEHLDEKAYFMGDIKKAMYFVSWRDEQGVKHSHWAAVRGPVETKLKAEPNKGVSYHGRNNTLILWIGQTDGTKALKRYTYLMVADRVWEITVVDDISQPGLVELHLVEALSNPELDNKEDSIARDEKIEFSCIFDKIREFKVKEIISVNPNLYIDGSLKTAENVDKVSITCESESFATDKDTVTFLEEGPYRVFVSYSGITNPKEYNISIVADIENKEETYVIEGNQRIKPMTSTFEEYGVDYYISGTKTAIPIEGSWKIDSQYASIIEQDKNRVVLKFTNAVGLAELKYMYEDKVLAIHKINMVSVFG